MINLNSNMIIESSEIIVTIIAVALSHFKLTGSLKKHINNVVKEIPTINKTINSVEKTVDLGSNIVEDLNPADAAEVEAIKKIIDVAATTIDDVTSANYSEKADILRKIVSELIKEFKIKQTHNEERLVDEHIIKTLNKKLVPAG
ncbi:hypothetical protein [Clostridium massiliamazoniense]|uniref:hypothetical protein n=1 Tax=Clostridium massiliamazoniense TaxID=1347366 RepID=UPI0006D81F86|nr:hypothetical protein [Clostridium massiliamazoniense]